MKKIKTNSAIDGFKHASLRKIGHSGLLRISEPLSFTDLTRKHAIE
jgi:hypothetical protein